MRISFLLFLISLNAFADGKITNADIYSAAAIAFTKMAASTAHNACTFNGSGFIGTGVAPGASGNVLKSNGTDWVSSTESDPTAWSLLGNTGTTAGTNFVGTTDAKDLVFKTNAAENMRLKNSNGFLGVNETSPQAPLHVSTAAGDALLTIQNKTSASHGRYDFGVDTSGFFHFAQNGAGFYLLTGDNSGDKLAIGNYGALNSSTLGIAASAEDNTPLTVQGFSGGTSDLQDWRTGAGPTTVAKIDSTGKLTAANILDNGLSVSQLVATDGSKNLISQATGNLTDAGTDGIVVTAGNGAVVGSGTSLAQHVADSTHNGYLSSTDWSTFNGKQAAGNYITALTGDVTASGPGSVAATVVKVNGVAYGTSPSTNTVPVVTSSNTITYEALPNAAMPTYTNHLLTLGTGSAGLGTISAPASGTLLTGVSGADPAFSATPTLGVATTTKGTLSFAGNTSGTVTVQPAAAAGTYNFNLPITAGTSNQPLISGGGGSTAMGWGSLSGNTSTFGTTSGSLTSGNCVKIDASGNLVDAGAACGSGSSNFGAGYLSVDFENASATNNWTNATTGSAGDFTEHGTMTLSTITTASGFTSITKVTNLPGINFTPPNTGKVKVCANFELNNSTTIKSLIYLTDLSNNAIGYTSRLGGTLADSGGTLCGILSVTATTATGAKLRGVVDTGTVTMGGTTNLPAVLMFQVEYIQ